MNEFYMYILSINRLIGRSCVLGTGTLLTPFRLMEVYHVIKGKVYINIYIDINVL